MTAKEEFYSKLVEYLEGTKDFILEKSPELFKEILKFDTIEAYLSSIVCLLIPVIGIIMSLKFYKEKYEKSYDRPTLQVVVWIATTVVTPLLFVQLCSNVRDIIQIKVAPKYYLLKKLK